MITYTKGYRYKRYDRYDARYGYDYRIDTFSTDGCDCAALRAVRGDLPGGGARQLYRHLHRLHQQAHAGQLGGDYQIR